MDIQVEGLGIIAKNNRHKIALEFFLCLLVCSIISLIIAKTVWNNYIGEIHTMLELVCIFIALSAFLTLWNTTKYHSKRNYILIYGFLIIAVFNMLHTYYYYALKLYPAGYYDISIRFSILGRITEILILLLGFKKIEKRTISKWAGLTLSIMIIIITIFILFRFQYIFPTLVVPQMNITKSKITIEYILVLFYFIALYKVAGKINCRDIIIYRYIFIALILVIPSEICYTLYHNPSSFFLVYGHVLRIVCYLYIYKGVIVSSVSYPYKEIEKIKGAFDYVNIGIALISLESEVIAVNKYLCGMLGYTEKELLKLRLSDLTCLEDKYIDQEIVSNLQKLSIPRMSCEKRYIHKLGHELWINVTYTFAFDENNRPIYIVTEMNDISSNKKIAQLEEKIEKEKKVLEETIELDKIKTEFFANLSHELRTPLNVIIGALQLTEFYIDKKGKESLEDVIKNNKAIKQNSRRLLRLVNNLIDTTKIDAGFFQLRLRNFNIISIVEDITLSVAEYTKARGIDLVFDTDVEEKIIACDPDKIERIMLNLLSNAIKFTHEGGSIYVNIYDGTEEVIISVKDTGIGIPEDKQDVIFERFRQADKSFTRNQEGSGIGLSLVKSLVELHSGHISLLSEEGKGSEFIITLPARNVEDSEDCQLSYAAVDRVERVQVEFSDIYSND